uniref:Cyclic nucleotide-binding protein n=1 Tax=Cyanothece sp. (strain PCC 7425 / ATCC 29141) TaxID=395961 RepID=B8HVX5_CYAP4
MIKSVADAIARGDYLAAAQLLQTLPAHDPWVMLYTAQVQERSEEFEQAETLYRQLLKTDYGPKIATEARRGLQRLSEQHKPAPTLVAVSTAPPPLPSTGPAPTLSAPDSNATSVLILEPLPNAAKPEAARKFAQVMNIETYAARLFLPSRGWRFYRAGRWSEIAQYGQQLSAQGIPVCWLPLEALQQVQVLEVSYFQSVTPEGATVWVEQGQAQPFSCKFAWAEVTQRVSGLLPIFEQVVARDKQGKFQRKEEIQDHAQICDLHLPGRNTILRLYRGVYQFNQGISLSTPKAPQTLPEETSWANWKHLEAFLDYYLPTVPHWTDFTLFAETIVDQTDLLSPIPAHIDLFRREESCWDPAFHLYSGLIFWKNLN